MAHLLSGKITMVIGGTGTIGRAIVQSFLTEDATVIVPAKSSSEVCELKKYLAATTSGKLLSFLTDMPDYCKAAEIEKDINEEFGRIDLAVTAIDNCCSDTVLTKLEITDWQRMVEQNITPFFICGRLMLSYMQDEKSMYVTVSDVNQPKLNNKDVLGCIASSMQVKIAEIIASETQDFIPRYHHIFLNKNQNQKDGPKEQYIEKLGPHIIQLYLSDGTKNDEVFLNFPSSLYPSEIMD